MSCWQGSSFVFSPLNWEQKRGKMFSFSKKLVKIGEMRNFEGFAGTLITFFPLSPLNFFEKLHPWLLVGGRQLGMYLYLPILSYRCVPAYVGIGPRCQNGWLLCTFNLYIGRYIPTIKQTRLKMDHAFSYLCFLNGENEFRHRI